MPRLKAAFWVQAYLRRLDLATIPAFVVRKGDETAGAVLIKSNPLNGEAALFSRVYDESGARVWQELAAGPEAEIDLAIARQVSFDPDLWVIEVEDRESRTLLDEEGLFG